MFLIPFYIKLALGFLVFGFLFHIIGFTTPYWVQYGNIHFGLWTSCGSTIFGNICSSYSASSAIGAARAFEVLACLLFIVVFILLIVYIKTLRRDIHLASLVCTFVVVALIIIGVICFVSERKSYLSWSFALTIIGAILAFVAGIILIIHRMRGVTGVTGSSSSGGVVTSRTTRTVTTTVVVK